jgi:hypothetical protein
VRQAKNIALDLGYTLETFKASKGWLSKFLRTFNMSCRRATNNHTLTPEQRKPSMLQFLWEWRKLQQTGTDPNVNRFPPEDTYTGDSVPMEDGNKDSTFISHFFPILCPQITRL